MKKTPFISKKLLLAALLLPLGFANAQTKPNPLLEAPEPIPKWELSVDLKPLIGQGNSDGVGYILRKYTKHNTAFRFRVSTSALIIIPSAPNAASITNYSVYGGYEWIKRKKRNSSFFYGFDVSSKGLINSGLNYSIFGLEGFIGVRQKVINNISISLESHAGIIYQYLPVPPSNSSSIYNKPTTLLSLSTNPLFGLYLSYHL